MASLKRIRKRMISTSTTMKKMMQRKAFVHCLVLCATGACAASGARHALEETCAALNLSSCWLHRQDMEEGDMEEEDMEEEHRSMDRTYQHATRPLPPLHSPP